MSASVEWRTLSWLPEMEVSENGDLRHTGKIRPGHRKGQRISGHVKADGYRTYFLLGRTFYAHRLVCEAWHGVAPEGRPYAAHNDGNPRNNHFTNLRWASQKENLADCKIHGTRLFGSRVGTAKLNEDQVVVIRSLVAAGETCRSIAAQFGCSRQSVQRIAAGEQWSHLGGDIRPPRKKKFCARGHEISEPRPKNRSCRQCQTLNMRAWRERKREELGLEPDQRLA